MKKLYSSRSHNCCNSPCIRCVLLSFVQLVKCSRIGRVSALVGLVIIAEIEEGERWLSISSAKLCWNA